MLVTAAITICVLASASVPLLLSHARIELDRRLRLSWLTIAVLAFGGGVWSTHFVAMLAYGPMLPIAYDLLTTLLSCVLMIGFTAAAFGLHLYNPKRSVSAVSGIILGLGVAVMHFVGLTAIRVPGTLLIDPGLVALSVGIGTVFIAPAMILAVSGGRVWWIAATGLMALGVAALHFLGMAALTILPDDGIAVPHSALTRQWLAVLIGGGTLLGLLATAVAVVFVGWTRAASARQESARLRGFASATFDGIVVLTGDGTITDANERLVELLGEPLQALLGRPMGELLEFNATTNTQQESFLDLLAADQHKSLPATLLTRMGPIPIELRSGTATDVEGLRRVLALRDLRERLAADSRIRHLATHDPLTGLANRTMLHERLAQALTSQDDIQVAVMMIDLDHFKPVNDVHGHVAGDHLLEMVGARLRALARETDTIARLGGDEFAVIASFGITGHRTSGPTEIPLRLVQRIITTMQEPFVLLDGAAVQIGCSIGVALAPADGQEAGILLARADTAMYRAKATGRGCYQFFEPGMDILDRERAKLVADFRLALAAGELVPHFQPLVELQTGRLLGFEMLARWPSPARGLVPSAEFIRIAEDNGLMDALTKQLLGQACRIAMTWPNDLMLACNISPLQLRDRRLPAMVRTALTNSGLPAVRLEIELTESALMANFGLAKEILEELKSIGVRLTLDDFGTGYSSLQHLHRLPIDKIKIDAGFVRSMSENRDSSKIVAAIIGLGHSLGLPTVAEGVEDAAAAEAVSALGCDAGQGWFFGRDMSATDATSIAWTRHPKALVP